MNYIVAYLFMGVVFFGFAGSRDVFEVLMDGFGSGYFDDWEKTRAVGAAVIFASLCILLWPLLGPIFLLGLFGSFDRRKVKYEPFSVTNRHLKSRTSINEVESNAFIHDPLNAVPNLPFGFLNPTWEKLKDGMSSGDEIWTFKTPDTQWRGESGIREGYVIVKQGKTADWFILP